MQDSFQGWSGRHSAKACRPQSAYEPKDWMQPISTTHREAFQAWQAPKRTTFKPKEAREPPAATMTGRSTMQDSYQPISNFKPTQNCRPVVNKLEYTDIHEQYESLIEEKLQAGLGERLGVLELG